ncbi:MAG: glycosyltransferase [Burkholderiaceae bacterium]|nr:glycosyltransferase [Burkholderiaceae bacterium]
MNLATVTVTYNPDLTLLDAQLRQLPTDALRVVVDNASSPDLREPLRALCETHGAVFIANAANRGLATGLNVGARKALELAPDLAYLLLLDQDTEPGPDGVQSLVKAYETVLERGDSPGCAGPRMVDAHTGLQHGFHCMTRWRWQRRFPPTTQTEPVRLANLNGSGTLIPAPIYRELGGLDDALFIDHVDTEWSFRVLSAGYALYGIPHVAFVHRMGEASVRFWLFGWRVWPSRSPQRHFFLFRNAVILMRRDYVPAVWKAWAVAKLLVTFAVHALTDPRRKEQCQAMLRGLREGLAAKAIR